MTMLAPAEPAERGTGTGAASYRPHLDGMRAVAVFLVIAFHAGIGRLNGGFIGVDVFFVLSGFLVTQLLLRDLDRDGTVRFRRFYSRRMRRLLPAALITLIGTAFVFTVIASPIEALDARGAMRAAALWFSNWYFIGEASDYFATDVAASPFLHFWSLSIEEQFYLLWPLALAGLFRICRRAGHHQRTVLRAVVAVLALASLSAAWWIGRTDVTRAYYGTDTRAYQLLAGALLALTPTIMTRFKPSRWSAWIGGAGFVVLGLMATSWWDVTPVSRGIGAVAVTLVLIVSLEASAGGPRWFLSIAPVVYLGRISYGIYLWHWIVILALDATLELSSVTTAVVTAVVAAGLASLSYQLLEMPVRSSGWLDGRGPFVIAAGLVASLLVGFVIGPRILENDPTTSAAQPEASSSTKTPVPDDLDWESAAVDRAENFPCRPDATDACVLVSGGEPHVLLVGDSTASMYIPALEAMADAESFTLSAATSPGCGWVRGIQRFDGSNEVGPLGRTSSEACGDLQDSWYDQVIPAVDADVILVVHRPYDDPASSIPLQDAELGELTPGSPNLADAYEQRSRAAIEAMRATGATVVILEPGPAATDEEDPLVCISGAAHLEACRFTASDGPMMTETIGRELAAEDPGVWSIDIDPMVCPGLPTCDPVLHGAIVRWDGVHLTTEFSRTLAEPLTELLREAGVLA